jgi:predicted peptidase
MKRFFWLILCILLLSCSSLTKLSRKQNSTFSVHLDTLKLFDSTRNREIPIAIFQPDSSIPLIDQKLIVFSHGYGQNKGGDYLEYSYLTNYLASQGYFVVSIQHELSTDSLLPLIGIPQIVRRPFWDRGAENIFFVINELKKSTPELDFKNITLIGHSNGGDMTALFPQKYPNIVNKIVTLDNRRMAFPQMKAVKVYSLRSSDQQADEGVLPSAEAQKKFRMTIKNYLIRFTIVWMIRQTKCKGQKSEIIFYHF